MSNSLISPNPIVNTLGNFDSFSEFPRHWFFKGQMVINGKEQPQSLLSMIINTNGPQTNSSIAFSDNSSSIKSIGQVTTLNPKAPTDSSQMIPVEKDYHITFTAETHNFPTGIAPFPGAETGIGGR
jgi:phosphoribosylformylglycinamidine synthase